ncbi:MAG TPA: hypothetical protein DHW78_10205 [Ruminococcaceae bacterium]|mgnify:FL=1|jgi:hypothetical protein|nr:hypothetical protein [Oscillospiraceae bacterium]HCA30459.1 hypothetical protein [Oscillospiraceae bacterium]HCM24678.1 hypothetical protein [Oscillospiraceae bacterium]
MEDFLRSLLQRFFSVMNWQLQDAQNNILQTPETFFGHDKWTALLQICASAIMPLALTILGFCIAVDLYHLYDKNNGSLDIEVFTMEIVKFIIPFLLISNTYGLLDAITKLVNSSLQSMSNLMQYSPAQMSLQIDKILPQLTSPNIFGQIGCLLELLPLTILMHILGMMIYVIIVARLFEIAMLWLISPIPTAFMVDANERQIGTAFYKQFFAVLLQGFLMMICLYLFNILITNFMERTASGLTGLRTLWAYIAMGNIGAFSLFKTGSLAKRIINTF